MPITGKDTGQDMKNVLKFRDPKKNIVKYRWIPEQSFLLCKPGYINFAKSISKKLIKHNHPSKKLYVIGITGTNGKTTVAYLLGEALKSAGLNPFVLGTLNSGNKDLSTPESDDILNFMKAHLDNDGTHFIMEVTSEGIDQNRIADIDFDIKLLTNITHDHLDYHKTFERYQQTKLDFMNDGHAHKIYPKNFEQERLNFKTRLLGDFNQLNIKAAVNVLQHIGISEQFIENTLSTCSAPRGRLESVDKGQAYIVLIDYAHSPDSLENVLITAKKIAAKRKGRLLVLFGCGGDRDHEKRPKMGRVASDISDYLVITEDNPRLENSPKIIREIMYGMNPRFRNYVLIQNRHKAIKHIINQSQDNDVIVLAGKGHETYQILKDKTIPFDDREEAINAIMHRLAVNESGYVPKQ